MDNLRASSLLGSLVFAYYARGSCVRRLRRTMAMEDAYQVKITLQSARPMLILIHWPSSDLYRTRGTLDRLIGALADCYGMSNMRDRRRNADHGRFDRPLDWHCYSPRLVMPTISKAWSAVLSYQGSGSAGLWIIVLEPSLLSKLSVDIFCYTH